LTSTLIFETTTSYNFFLVTVNKLDVIYSTVLFTITSISNSITIVEIIGWPLLLGKTAISCVLAVFVGEII